jgi:phosphatidylglycerol:prolipoprotein diacylglycerol transferase
MLPVVNVGPFALYTPGLIFLLGSWLIVQAVRRAAFTQGLDGERMEIIVVIVLVSGIIGARVGYALTAWPAYVNDPWAFLSRDLQAFSLPYGIVTGVIVGSWQLWRQRWPLWVVLDTLAPGVALAALTYALMQFASGDGYGLPSTVPWAIPLWGEYRHPTQLYAALTALIALIVWRKNYRKPQPAGSLFLNVCAILAAGTLIGNGFSAADWLLPGRVRASQVIALAVLILIIWVRPKITLQPKIQ